ncbi:unnamed protein product [Candidula unifasciata]|uniref:Coiled-coil domain-containing protein 137 n=1 Tax=Candidula unifasciata TaxID=100452 RepID=A0A8S3YSY0_9EUPU|nr:unnamed protein product [Candidula unifasciata]
MGKLAKPQRSKKHKKLKCVDPFYVGSRKDVRQAACNQKPTNCEQEVPKKLRHLGFSIDGVRSGQVGKKSRNKFLKHPDAPHKYNNQFSTVLGTKASSRKNEPKKHSADNSGKAQQLKKHKKRFMPKISEKDVSDFIDNLQPPRPYTESFTFKKQSQETDSKFMRRVHEETNRALTKTQIDEQLEMSDKRKLLLKLKPKKGMSDKKKERLKDKKKKKVQAVREKRQEKNLDFGSLKDSIQFGDVVHAPPVLSVRPKKAAGPELDRPGLRMPELKAIIDGHKEQASSAMAKPGHSVTEKQTRPVGKSIKRKAMSKVEQHLADVQRDSFISAYRQRKQGQLSLLK